MSGDPDFLLGAGESDTAPVPPPSQNPLVSRTPKRPRTVQVALVATAGAIVAVAVAVVGPLSRDNSSRPQDLMVAGQRAPACEMRNLRFALAWVRTDEGALSGTLSAKNEGGEACKLTEKPQLMPLAPSGGELPAPTLVEDDLRLQPVILEGDQTGESITLWNSWCGEGAGDRVRVRLDDEVTQVTPAGPRQPACRPQETATLISGWFDNAE